MRTIHLTFVLLVAFATLALLADAAAAGPGPRRPSLTVSKPTTTPIPASAIVPKTAAVLAGSTYPWVQPHWIRVGGMSLAILPRTIRLSTITQPPMMIHIG